MYLASALTAPRAVQTKGQASERFGYDPEHPAPSCMRCSSAYTLRTLAACSPFLPLVGS